MCPSFPQRATKRKGNWCWLTKELWFILKIVRYRLMNCSLTLKKPSYKLPKSIVSKETVTSNKYCTKPLSCNTNKKPTWKCYFTSKKWKSTSQIVKWFQVLHNQHTTKLKMRYSSRLCVSSRLNLRRNWRNFCRKTGRKKLNLFSKDSISANLPIRKVSGRFQLKVRSRLKLFYLTLGIMSIYNQSWPKF